MKKNQFETDLNFYLDQLRLRKIKITENRQKVLLRFLTGKNPWTLNSLFESLNGEVACELSSIFRALADLEKAGILEKFTLPGDRQTYYSLVARHGHHHHIICQDCGIISHLDFCLPAKWMGKLELTSGFQITEHHLEFKGLCGRCK